jgi:tetratricopeptide (TPR) repeat protein
LSPNHRRDLLIGLLLVAAVLALYAQTRGHDFLTYDDDRYVVGNPMVNRGLTWEGVRWAFTRSHASNWHPLTWLSHMLDCTVFGLEPGPHHLVNVFLHALNALLLYAALRFLTGATWPSALVAALFALHPLRVQSVAWVAERKDLLAGLFWMLGLLAWGWYAKRPGVRRYLVVAATLALGLMVKPMLVTLPFVFLLLDLWPLKRWRSPEGGKRRPGWPPRRLILEKLPLLALALASSWITAASQRAGGSVISIHSFPLLVRIQNALYSYVAYLGKTIWPTGLAFHYPHPGAEHVDAPWLAGAAAGAALLIAAATVLAWRGAARRPYAVVGWLWFLGTLVPVIGLYQVGWQGMADRYTYIPLIGIYLIVAWGGAEIAARSAGAGRLLAASAVIALACLATVTWFEIGYWRDSPTLYARALEVTRHNAFAHNNLGNWLVANGRVEEGVEHLEAARALIPDSPLVLGGLGEALIKQGRLDEAVESLSLAVELQPSFVAARRNLAYALAETGDLDRAAAQFTLLLEQRPDDARAHHKLGRIRLRERRAEEAVAHLAEAVRLEPGSAELHTELGMALYLGGRTDESVAAFRRALSLQPDYFLAHHRLGLVQLVSGHPAEAVASFRAALAANPEFTPARESLATALDRLREGEGAP